MAEYIDREKIFPNGVFYVNAENPDTSLNELINRICNLPTADVVPKSEVERLEKEIKEIIAYVKQFEGYAPYCAEELEKKYTEQKNG